MGLFEFYLFIVIYGLFGHVYALDLGFCSVVY